MEALAARLQHSAREATQVKSEFALRSHVSRPDTLACAFRDLICRDLACETELEGIPLFRDTSHLNLEGSKLLGRLCLEVADNPFGNSDKT
jgi:hypothetical protein